jgi:DNA polymerase-1
LPSLTATNYERLTGLGNELQAGDVILELELGRPLKKNEALLPLPVTIKGVVPPKEGAPEDRRAYRLSNGKSKTLTNEDKVVFDRVVPPAPPAYEISLILTIEALEQLVQDYTQFDYFVFDCETNATREPRASKRKDADIPALDERTNKPTWMALAGPGRVDVIPFGHPNGPPQLTIGEVLTGLKPLFFSGITKVNHNVKFDILTLAKYWREIPPGPYADTGAIAHLLDENLRSYRLGDVIEHYFDYSYRKLAREGEPIDSFSFDELARYVGLDAKLTQLLYEFLMPYLERQPLLMNINDLEGDVLEVLMYAKRHGALIDKESLQALAQNLEYELDKLSQQIYKVVGYEFNIASTQQRGTLLYEKLGLECKVFTDEGSPSTSDKALQPLMRKHPVVPLLIRHGDLSKMYGTYASGFTPYIEDDGRIRAGLNPFGTVTGRFSASKPNLQNVPRQSDESEDGSRIRSMFIAPPGFVLVVGDFGQVEYRTMAHFAGPLVKKSRMLLAFLEEIDLHAMTASGLYDKPIEEVTKEERQSGKTANFLLMFGGGVTRLMDNGWPKKQAETVFDGFHQTYPEVGRFTEMMVKRLSAMDKPYAETLWGRRRRLKDIKLPGVSRELRQRRSYAERQAVNHVVQGTAADLNKAAMVRMFRRIERTGHLNRWHLILTVHDEIMVEVPEDDAEEAVALLREAMEGVKADLLVPLTTDIHYGQNWAAAK